MLLLLMMMLLVVVVVVVVVDVVVVVVDDVVVVVVVVARRARARQTHPEKLTQTARARTCARGASPHICGKNVSPQTQPKPWVFTMFLQQARKQKLKIRIAKQQKHCILRCFWPVGCENSRSEKYLKHRNLQCFSLPLKTKQRYLRCFPSLANPK